MPERPFSVGAKWELEAARRRLEAAEDGPSPSEAPTLQYARHYRDIDGKRCDLRSRCLAR